MNRRTDSQAGGDGGELGQLPGHRVDLDPQLSGGNQNQHPSHLGCFRFINQTLQHWQHERSRLPCAQGIISVSPSGSGTTARSQCDQLVPAYHFTCPSGGAGTQVSAQQADGDARLLDGGRLLKAQSCDGLTDRKQCESQSGFRRHNKQKKGRQSAGAQQITETGVNRGTVKGSRNVTANQLRTRQETEL